MSSRQSVFQLKFTRKRSKSLCSMVTSEKGNEAKVTPIDFRTKIDNILQFPYRCIGKILSKFVDTRGKTQIKKGTASKIGSNIFLTAAHVIFCPEMQKVADQIYYYPAQILERDKNSYSKKQGIKVTNLYINPIYFNKGAKDKSMFDFALLELQQNEYLSKPEYLKINFDFIPQDNQDVKITICGFSEHPDDEKYLIFQEENQTLQSNENDFIYYLHTTYQGYSGAPILLRAQDNSIQVIGIHKGTLSQKNYGISMNHLAMNEKHLTECIKSNFINWLQMAKISFKALLSMFLKSQKKSLQTIKEMKNKLQTTENNFKDFVWEGFVGNKNFGNFQKVSHSTVNPAQKQVGESASEIFEIKKELSQKNEQNMSLLQQNNTLKKQIKQLRTQMQDRIQRNVIMFQNGIQKAKQQFQINSQRIEQQVKQKIISNLEKINRINEKMSHWRNDKCELNRLYKKLEQFEEVQKTLKEDIALLNKKIANESDSKNQNKQLLTVPKQLEETLSSNSSHQLSFKDTLLEPSMYETFQNNSSDSSLKLNQFHDMKTLSAWEKTGLDSSKNMVHSQPNLLHVKSKSKFKSKTMFQGQIMELDFNVIIEPKQNEGEKHLLGQNREGIRWSKEDEKIHQKDIKQLLNPIEYLKAYSSKNISKIYYKSDKLRIQHSKEKYNIVLSPQGYNLYLTNFNLHIGEFFAYNWLNLEFLSLSYCQIDDLKWEKFSFFAKKFLPNILALDFHGNTITTVKKQHLESFGKVLKIWFTLKSKQSLLTEQSKLEIQKFKLQRLQNKVQVKIRC